MRLAAPRPMTAAVLVVLASTSAGAQTPALSRTPDGRPNLQGIWQVLNTAAWDLQDHSARLGVPAGQAVVDGNDIPYQPATLKQKQQNFANRATADPETKGFLPGVPRIMYMPLPFQIISETDVMGGMTLPGVRMPNRDRFVGSSSTGSPVRNVHSASTRASKRRARRAPIEFTHAICPECKQKLDPTIVTS